jgi:hypothetical protein
VSKETDFEWAVPSITKKIRCKFKNIKGAFFPRVFLSIFSTTDALGLSPTNTHLRRIVSHLSYVALMKMRGF